MEEENKDIELTDENQGEPEQVQENTVDNGEKDHEEVAELNEPEQNNVPERKESESIETEPEKHNEPEEERKFTQEDVDKAVKKALAKRLPPKEEMDEFKAWKDSKKTEQEKAAEREKHYLEIEQANVALKHENAVIKAGVRAEDVDYVLFKVEKMDGDDFEDNLKEFLKKNDKFTAPKTKVVEGIKHEPKQKETITKADLNKMSYREKIEFYEKNPGAYESAMRG